MSETRPDLLHDIIGLIPAAGQATRLAPLPCSKELYPVGLRSEAGSVRPKVVCQDLLEKMARAGIGKVYVVLRAGKWDIPAYLGDGSAFHVSVAYLMMRLPFGPPYSLDQAYPFVQNSLVAMGFPDILIEPDDAFVHLRTRQTETSADIVLGLFPTNRPETCDMVATDPAGRAQQIFIKPTSTDVQDTWLIAVWTPTFTQFLHDHLATTMTLAEASPLPRREMHVGEVIQAAIEAGLHVDTLQFRHGWYLDIGTPEGLASLYRTRES
jgi:glucose-1-phosphate thymidylyltransferase